MCTRRSSLQRLGLVLAMAGKPWSMALAQERSLAIDGYDPVAYFTQRRPAQGKADISFDWDDRRYRFATAGNRDIFAANPDRYEPQFAGPCSSGVAAGKRIKADPALWRIVDGKLYLFSKPVASEESLDKTVVAAQANWKSLK